MASLTTDKEPDNRAAETGPAAAAPSLGASLRALPALYKGGAGLAAVILVAIACYIIWGPFEFRGEIMEFPTTVSTETKPAGNTTIVVEQTVRDVTSAGIDNGVRWLNDRLRFFFNGIKSGVTYALVYISNFLQWVAWPAIVLGLVLLAYALGRGSVALFTAVALLFIGFMDMWADAIDTIALMVVAVAVCMAIGLPLGVLGARSRIADNIMRPILDGMQTMPSFVYLLPGILFFGLGPAAGIFATLIYAVPPVIRLTNLGIRQVSAETVEAARSFGAAPRQVLIKVQIPMALPTIMAGINQTTMMALAMVTIASLVASGGLGDPVLRALQKQEYGTGAIAGLAIVFLAIVIDRLTQAAAGRQQRSLSAG